MTLLHYNRKVEVPILDTCHVQALLSGESVESPVPLCEGDLFVIYVNGRKIRVLCSTSSGKCIISPVPPEVILIRRIGGGST